MRVRKRKWVPEELNSFSAYCKNPEENIGKWKECFEKEQPLYIELGCGKGTFIGTIAARNLEINYLGIDLVSDMLGLAKRNMEKIFEEKKLPIHNVLITRYDIERIQDILNIQDEVEGIYINFCNPWPRTQHKKRRLTHTRQLEKYKSFLKDNAKVYFKTDDDELFNDSLKYFALSGYEILEKTYDLHSENVEDNIITEHEKMFSDEGIKIKALIAEYHKK